MREYPQIAISFSDKSDVTASSLLVLRSPEPLPECDHDGRARMVLLLVSQEGGLLDEGLWAVLALVAVTGLVMDPAGRKQSKIDPWTLGKDSCFILKVSLYD